MTNFDYLLNAFERASQAPHPASEGYADKRNALFEYVRKLEGKWKDAGERCPQCGTGISAARPEVQPLNWVRVDYGPPSDAPAWPGETIFFVDKHRTRWRLELPQLPLAMNSGERNG